MGPVALAAGLISAGIVIAYFVAIDYVRTATSTGPGVSAQRRTFVKQLETVLRPVAQLPSGAAGQLRQKLSQAGNPGSLTPAGFQAVRYSFASLLARS